VGERRLGGKEGETPGEKEGETGDVRKRLSGFYIPYPLLFELTGCLIASVIFSRIF
jgi:hypothetical protein